MIYKPDIEKVIERHKKFWSLEELKTPLIIIQHKDVGVRTPGNHSEFWNDPGGFVEYYCRIFEKRIEVKDDFIPCLRPPFSHALIAGILGAEVSLKGEALWAKPLLNECKRADELRFDTGSEWFLRFKRYMDELIKFSRDRFMVTIYETQGIGDMMATLRGSQELIYDIFDNPDGVKRLARKCLEIGEKFAGLQKEMINGQNNYGGAWYSRGWIPENTICFCEHNSIAFSPDKFSEFILPYDIKLVERFDFGYFTGYGKSCGHILNGLMDNDKLAVFVSATADENPDEELIKKYLGKKRFIVYSRPEKVEETIKRFGAKGIMIITYCHSIEESNGLIKQIERID